MSRKEAAAGRGCCKPAVGGQWTIQEAAQATAVSVVTYSGEGAVPNLGRAGGCALDVTARLFAERLSRSAS